jgi:hypothetical protein
VVSNPDDRQGLELQNRLSYGVEPSHLLDPGEPSLLDEELVQALRDEDVRDITREFAATRWGAAARVGNRATVQEPDGGAERLEMTRARERRRAAGRSTRVRSPRHNSWEVVYQKQNGSGRYRRLGSGVKWNSQGLNPPQNFLRS